MADDSRNGRAEEVVSDGGHDDEKDDKVDDAKDDKDHLEVIRIDKESMICDLLELQCYTDT